MGNIYSQYRSPIDIKMDDALACHQHIQICGKNHVAKYDSYMRNFYIDPEDRIILTLNGKEYRLVEYHFHTHSSHTVNGKKYPAELHFVFAKSNKDVCGCRFDLCCGNNDTGRHFNNRDIQYGEDDSLLVLSKFVVDDICGRINLADLQPTTPCTFYSYDGRLVTGDQSIPVKWIVDDSPIGLPIDSLDGLTKPSGETQPFDDRILLYSCNK